MESLGTLSSDEQNEVLETFDFLSDSMNFWYKMYANAVDNDTCYDAWNMYCECKKLYNEIRLYFGLPIH